MLTGRQLIGLSIRDKASGEKIGRICDIYGNMTNGQILGYGVAIEKLFSKTMLLPASAVESIGINGMIADAAALKPLRTKYETVLAYRGSMLYSALGRELGVVSDVILGDGRIAALEISGGLLADVVGRRTLVSWNSVQADDNGGFIRNQV